MKDRRWWTFCLFALFLFALCNAARVPPAPCKVDCDGRKCKFEVSPQLHPEEYDCEFSWNNQTNFVLANSQGCIKGVLAYTNTSLEISQCMNVTYDRNCVSQSTRESPRYNITCDVNCIDQRQGSRGHYLSFSLITLLIIIAMSVLLHNCF